MLTHAGLLQLQPDLSKGLTETSGMYSLPRRGLGLKEGICIFTQTRAPVTQSHWQLQVIDSSIDIRFARLAEMLCYVPHFVTWLSHWRSTGHLDHCPTVPVYKIWRLVCTCCQLCNS